MIDEHQCHYIRTVGYGRLQYGGGCVVIPKHCVRDMPTVYTASNIQVQQKTCHTIIDISHELDHACGCCSIALLCSYRHVVCHTGCICCRTDDDQEVCNCLKYSHPSTYVSQGEPQEAGALLGVLLSADSLARMTAPPVAMFLLDVCNSDEYVMSAVHSVWCFGSICSVSWHCLLHDDAACSHCTKG